MDNEELVMMLTGNIFKSGKPRKQTDPTNRRALRSSFFGKGSITQKRQEL